MLVKHQILHTLPQIHTNSTDTKGPTKSPSEVVTKEVEKVLVHPLTIIQTTEHSSENQENEGIKATTLARNHSDVMSLDNSAQTYNPARISSSKMGVTLPQTHPTNQTAPSSGLISTVNTEILTTTATNNEITTGKQDTGGMTREGKTSTTQPGKTHATKPKEGNIMQPTKAETSKPPGTQNEGEARTKQGRHKGSKSNPGPIVASVITGVLVLMLIMIVMILVRNHRRKKKQIINSDWAGPSPFLEGSIEPNLPSEPFHQNKSKRISLHSFLPQQLSNRLAMLPEDNLHMVDVSGGCTFGRNVEDDVLAEAGKAEMEKEQIQTHHTDQSQPAASPPSDISAAETANTPTVPAISLSIQQTPHSDETIPFTPLGNTTVAPPHFEDVDLDRALEPTAESETLPTPPPPPQSQ
uniref:Uncharacterized protein n=2 Tax=Electrophorus electricus TaxID=8005 RepID=A0A4W4FPI7_ELEEL